MIRLPFPRAARRLLVSDIARPYRNLPRKTFSSQNSPPSSPSLRSRLEKLSARLPRFLQRYSRPLISAPVSHITSFLLLHELTAVIPIFAFAGFFHYTKWLPPFISEWKYVSDGVEKLGNWFRRRKWLSQKDADGVERIERGKSAKWWRRTEGGVRVVVEFATAWAIVKALLPLRLILSVWAAPWFARIAVVPCFNLAKKVSGFRGKAAVASSSATAGIGAVSGRNVAHEAPGTIGPVKSAATVGNEMERGVKDPP